MDLRVGGLFSSRMEAKDGSFGFRFAGTYTRIELHKLIEYSFGGSNWRGRVLTGRRFDGVTVRVTFDAETENPVEQQRGGWQVILDNFAKHVEASR